MSAYQINDRVHVKRTDRDGWGPHGDATITRLGIDGIGNPTAAVRLDRDRRSGKDASGQDWREWTVQISQLTPLGGAA